MSKKIIQNSFGGPEVLEVVEVDQPTADSLEPDQVLVRVAAAGVNVIDGKTRSGGGAARALGDPPFTLGWDLAGSVAAVGADVTKFAVGDRVFALSPFPREPVGYAQYAVVAADNLVATPSGVPDVVAGALPLAGLTAWQVLVEHGSLGPGQRVLIHGGGGGVGHLAVQIAHHLGAEVIATASSAKRSWITSLGASTVIDYAGGDFVTALEGSLVDIALDLIGTDDIGARSVELIKPGGVLAQLASGIKPDPAAQAAADEAGVRAIAPFVHVETAQLGKLAELVADGTIKVEVSEVYDLEKVADAHRAIDSGHVTGKLVLRTE